MVVGDTEEEIRAAVGDGSTWGLKVTYIPQDDPLGLAHCVLIARDFLGDEPFVLVHGGVAAGARVGVRPEVGHGHRAAGLHEVAGRAERRLRAVPGDEAGQDVARARRLLDHRLHASDAGEPQGGGAQGVTELQDHGGAFRAGIRW